MKFRGFDRGRSSSVGAGCDWRRDRPGIDRADRHTLAGRRLGGEPGHPAMARRAWLRVPGVSRAGRIGRLRAAPVDEAPRRAGAPADHLRPPPGPGVVRAGPGGRPRRLLALDRTVPFSLTQIAFPGLAPYQPLAVAPARSRCTSWRSSSELLRPAPDRAAGLAAPPLPDVRVVRRRDGARPGGRHGAAAPPGRPRSTSYRWSRWRSCWPSGSFGPGAPALPGRAAAREPRRPFAVRLDTDAPPSGMV